jgi:cytochrome c biogenesis protein
VAGLLSRLGAAAWSTLTSVRFAVLQIVALAVAGLIGTLVRQFPTFSLHDPGAYANQVADMHRRWDAISVLGLPIGPSLVDVFERLGFFRIFSAPWFVLMLSVLVISIVCCTLERTPKLWRGVRYMNIEQPPAFFDLRLSERAAFEGRSLSPDEVARVFRSRHFKVRQGGQDRRPGAAESNAATAGEWPAHHEREGAAYVYGDRNQYFRMATLLTHLGLILFLVGGAITAGFGFETVVFVGEGQTAPVQPVGTPHNLLVKNVSFAAPRRADGSFEDFRTDLAVYQDGQEIARKTIRVNDPLTVGGYVFHQNTFGPAADLDIRDSAGNLVWSGPVVMVPDERTGLPSAFITIPGSQLGLLMVLDRASDGSGLLGILGVGPTDAHGGSAIAFQAALGLGATSKPADTSGYSIGWTHAGAWTGMVIKNDPGQGLIWIAFLCLISGLLLTFYFPRRRVWARFGEGRVQLAMLAERYVDAPREFNNLLEDLSSPGRASGPRPEP